MIQRYKPVKNIVIYGRDSCMFCRKAKKLLGENEVGYVYYDITDDNNLQNIKSILKLDSDKLYIPQVFMNDKHIGGYTELEKAVGSGKHYFFA